MLTIFTIVINGQPWISKHLEEFKKLTIPWRWTIVEGVSSNANCTSWCKEFPKEFHLEGRSIDGTHEYLKTIVSDNVRVQNHPEGLPFNGKLEMINMALSGVDSGVVVEVDADEMWTADQLTKIYKALKHQAPGTAMQFHCRLFVGPSKYVVTRRGFGSNYYEWFRAWAWGNEVKFISHEPPVVNAGDGKFISREFTEAFGLVFDHFAYASLEQVQFKEQFYGYAGLTDGWKRLQLTSEPVRLSKFFPQIQDKTVVDNL